MGVNVDPVVSLLISTLRQVDIEKIDQVMLIELKKMSAKCPSSDNSIILDLWKKLYLISMNAKVNILDFVKGCGSNCIHIKRLGYQGIAAGNFAKSLFLLQNTVNKDLYIEEYCPDALIFISNVLDLTHTFKEIANGLGLPSEISKHFAKYLVAKSKYDYSQFFELRSEKEINYYVKLQIITDHNLSPKLTLPCSEYIEKSLNHTYCPYTRVKIIRVLQELVSKQNYFLNDNTISLLKTYIFGPSTKTKKQIEIATCVQAIRLLMISSHTYDSIEELVLCLINSKSINSRYIGLNLAVEFKICSEASISKLIEIGIDREMYFNYLYKFTDVSTYKYVYQHLQFIRDPEVVTEDAMKKKETCILKLLTKMCRFNDQEFICKALYEYPDLYRIIRNERLLNREQCKGFFKMLLEESNPVYYQMIYDLFPAKSKCEVFISDLGKKHLSNVIHLHCKEEQSCLQVLDGLFYFLCLHGNIELNRSNCLEKLNQLLLIQLPSKIISTVINGIMKFNLVLDTKMVYIENSGWVEYSIQDSLIKISYDETIKKTAKINILGTTKQDSKTKDKKVIETYELKKNCVINVTSLNNTVVKQL